MWTVSQRYLKKEEKILVQLLQDGQPVEGMTFKMDQNNMKQLQSIKKMLEREAKQRNRQNPPSPQ